MRACEMSEENGRTGQCSKATAATKHDRSPELARMQGRKIWNRKRGNTQKKSAKHQFGFWIGQSIKCVVRVRYRKLCYESPPNHDKREGKNEHKRIFKEAGRCRDPQMQFQTMNNVKRRAGDENAVPPGTKPSKVCTKTCFFRLFFSPLCTDFNASRRYTRFLHQSIVLLQGLHVKLSQITMAYTELVLGSV